MGAEPRDGRVVRGLITVGVIAIGLVLVYATASWTGHRIERDLTSRTRSALAAADIDAVVHFTGRDATVDGTVTGANQANAALTIVRGVWGVNSVVSRLQVAAPVVPSPVPTPSPGPTAPPLWAEGSISFDSGSVTLSRAGAAYLDSVVTYLRSEATVKVLVRGFADAAGSPAVNVALSQQRADAVTAYLVTHGVGAGRLHSQGMGVTEPVTSNQTPLGRSVNRRVELVFQEANR